MATNEDTVVSISKPADPPDPPDPEPRQVRTENNSEVREHRHLGSGPITRPTCAALTDTERIRENYPNWTIDVDPNKSSRYDYPSPGEETDGDEYSGSDDESYDDPTPSKETDGDKYLCSFRLDHELYGYATQGKIDSFKDTIVAEEVRDPNARIWLLSRLSLHNNKNTFLHIAARSGHAELAAEIIHLHKPLLFKQNFEGDTALHITAKAGNLDTANTLLREARGRGVDNNDHDVSRLLTEMNNEGNTPLHEALIHGHQSVAKCLIEGARTSVHFRVNEEGKTPLYLAAEEGFDEIMKLINEKAVEEKPEFPVKGKSPLHAAILGRRNNEILKIASSMEKFFESSKDEKGRTPLHSAASIGYVEGVRFLLGRRISDCHKMDRGGRFPIHSASSKGHVKIVKELLRHCLESKDLKNSNGQNILHVAARCGKDNLVKYFLKKGEFRMLINQKDRNGNTPLHLATMHHHPKVVYRLAWDTRTNLKLLNGSGLTALDISKSPMETIAPYHGFH